MSEYFYFGMSQDQKELAIKKIQQRTQMPETIVKQALEELNPLMDFEGERINIPRHVFRNIQIRLYNLNLNKR